MAENAAELGLAAEDTWDYLAPRYGTIRLPGEDGEPAWFADVIFIVSSADGFVVCAPIQAFPDSTVARLPADNSGDGALGDVTLDVGYGLLEHGAFEEVYDPAPVGVAHSMFGEPGQCPSLGLAALHVPLELLPEPIAAALVKGDRIVKINDDLQVGV